MLYSKTTEFFQLIKKNLKNTLKHFFAFIFVFEKVLILNMFERYRLEHILYL